MTALHFRKASEKDYPGVERLARELHALHASARPDFFTAAEQIYTVEAFRKILRSEGAEVHVAVEPGGLIVAYALLAFQKVNAASGVRERFFCNVDELCVSQERRRCGIGRAFFTYLENQARLAGAESLELTAWDFNQSAFAFYEDMGMSPRVRKLEKKL